MAESLNRDKSAKRSRSVLRGVLAGLVLAIALLLFYFHKSPASVIRFYLSLVQRIDIGDGGVLSGLPCSSPCVFGINSGETQLDQVMPLLEKYGISKCLTEPSVSWIAINCGFGRFNVQADTHTNVVNAIWFYPNVSIPLAKIIEKYADPDFVSLDREGLPEAPTIKMNLYWDAIRMSVAMPEIKGKIYVVKKSTRVEGVDFSDEILYQDAFEVEFGAFYKL